MRDGAQEQKMLKTGAHVSHAAQHVRLRDRQDVEIDLDVRVVCTHGNSVMTQSSWHRSGRRGWVLTALQRVHLRLEGLFAVKVTTRHAISERRSSAGEAAELTGAIESLSETVMPALVLYVMVSRRVVVKMTICSVLSVCWQKTIVARQ
jgi:hypothetical protein